MSPPAQIENQAYPVNVDALNTVFSPYGFVQKIAIFEKNGQSQARTMPHACPAQLLGSMALLGSCAHASKLFRAPGAHRAQVGCAGVAASAAALPEAILSRAAEACRLRCIVAHECCWQGGSAPMRPDMLVRHWLQALVQYPDPQSASNAKSALEGTPSTTAATTGCAACNPQPCLYYATDVTLALPP